MTAPLKPTTGLNGTRYLITANHRRQGNLRTDKASAERLYAQRCAENPYATIRLWECPAVGYPRILEQRDGRLPVCTCHGEHRDGVLVQIWTDCEVHRDPTKVPAHYSTSG
jgi:hypothetical protein